MRGLEIYIDGVLVWYEMLGVGGAKEYKFDTPFEMKWCCWRYI